MSDMTIQDVYARVGEIMGESQRKGLSQDDMMAKIDVYMASLSPEVKKALEEYNAQMEAVMKEMEGGSPEDAEAFMLRAFGEGTPLNSLMKGVGALVSPTTLAEAADMLAGMTTSGDYSEFRDSFFRTLENLEISEEGLGETEKEMVELVRYPDTDDIGWVVGRLKEMAEPTPAPRM